MGIARYDEQPYGCSWIMDERLARASHALVTDAGVWLVDPVDAPEALERVSALGPVAGVVQLLDRHNRDCAALAARFGVPHERLPAALPATPFELVRVLDVPRWHEAALWWPQPRVLAVAEAVGTVPLFTAGSGRAGLHPLRRPFPPGGLRRFEPEHLLVGHGLGVHGPEATPALQRALSRSRRDIPRLLAKLPTLARGS